MRTFTPYEGMTFWHPNQHYSYTIMDIENDILKCHWLNIATGDSGYCEMNVSYAEKLQNLNL